MSHHQPVHPVLDQYGRRESQSLENRSNKPNVADCVAAALRFEHQLRQWLSTHGNQKKKVAHAFVGAVAVSALTEEYMHLNDPNLPLGEQRIARDTKGVDLDLNYSDPVELWRGIGGKYIGRYDPEYVDLPGGHSEGRFIMRGESHLWEALSPWKGDVPFDVHSSNFRPDNYFGRPGITFHPSFNATREALVKNSLCKPVGALNIYRGPLLILLIDAHPRAAHPIHKDLRDLRLLVEGYQYYNQSLRPRAQNPFELERERFRHFLDQLTPEWHTTFHSKVRQLVADRRIAQSVAEWELMEEKVKEANSRKTYEDGEKAMVERYRFTFKFLLDRFEWTEHHPAFPARKAEWDAEQARLEAQQQRSLAKANPYDPVPRSLYRTAL